MKDSNVPSEWVDYQRSWRLHQPDWEYRLWTDADNAEFVRSTFPDFWPTFRELPFEIQRVDAVRYLILLEFGGLYADLDTQCLMPFDGLLAEPSFVASEAGRMAFEKRRGDVGEDTLRWEGVMAIHHFSNSWVSTLAGELVNPAPSEIPGFVFFAR